MRKQIIDLREKMREHNIDAYLIQTNDFHGSEYMNDYFKAREFMSGFTGSAGTLIVTMDDALLWTDGRYFLQAEAQLSGSGIKLMKSGEPYVPTILQYLQDTLSTDSTLGFDGRVTSISPEMESICNICSEYDLVDTIWPDRPAIIPSRIYELDESVTGKSAESKLGALRMYLDQNGFDYFLTTNLEEIAWLYNLRGSDIPRTPVFFAFLLVTPDEDRLYVLDDAFTSRKTHPYTQFFSDIREMSSGTLLLKKEEINYAILKSIPDHVEVVSKTSPLALMKCRKNETEIAATKNAHIKDGAAMAEFLCWLKSNIGKTEISEISASDYLENCRFMQEGCFDLSFDTISGYADNGAIIHYSATPETNKTLAPEGFLLVDSGGQYTDGTTDITRTIALGPLTDEMKKHYTAVLKGHIALARAEFGKGATGADLDKLARTPVNDIGLNYNHGTGHGVGHILSCHEGPQTISPRGGSVPIMPRMICSNEPGIYIEGSHGIRLENEILCVELPDGLFGFETITFCPFDRDAIIKDNLTEDELNWLNDYHFQVYQRISPHISECTKKWLREATNPL
jgi:Xaa-Pro aminopeptidase